MMQINSPIAKRNIGPNHDGKFSRALKKFSPVMAEISKFSDSNNRTEPLIGSDLLSDMTFAILHVFIRPLTIWFPHNEKLSDTVAIIRNSQRFLCTVPSH